jgi:hypothetical protein
MVSASTSSTLTCTVRAIQVSTSATFWGYLTEHSLRVLGEPGGLVEPERAMEEHFVELAGEASRAAVWAYATLTLVRHIYLSTLFPGAQPGGRALT